MINNNPAYNVANWIDDCICSCMNQDMNLGDEFEIIVVNDGSSDDTMEHLITYGNNIIIVEQSNAGVSAARNNGLKCAKGEYIWFIDGDDYIEPNVIYNKVYNYRVRRDSAMQSRNSLAHTRWLDSMLLMHESYMDIWVNHLGEISEKEKVYLQERINWSSANLLLGAMRLGKVKRTDILQYLESINCYPYPFLVGRISYKYGLKI
ncbi:glycosyltransferase family A protein [Bacteroides acidifaciens]|uniref:glycosyltransferase family A protein n=1 Tax=Bacteroides acidifaciens TaxID=85831 RepID=UPI003014D153